jgi:O-antigen/teichoic acid export membrane protein
MARFALWPARIMVVLPFLEALTAFQRGFLVRARETWPLVTSVAVQILIVVAILWVAVMPLRLVGALSAGAALVAGAAATAAVLALYSRRHRASYPLS